MANRWKEWESLYQKLRELADKYQAPILVVHQHPPLRTVLVEPPQDFIIIDHLSEIHHG